MIAQEPPSKVDQSTSTIAPPDETVAERRSFVAFATDSRGGLASPIDAGKNASEIATPSLSGIALFRGRMFPNRRSISSVIHAFENVIGR